MYSYTNPGWEIYQIPYTIFSCICTIITTWFWSFYHNNTMYSYNTITLYIYHSNTTFSCTTIQPGNVVICWYSQWYSLKCHIKHMVIIQFHAYIEIPWYAITVTWFIHSVLFCKGCMCVISLSLDLMCVRM